MELISLVRCSGEGGGLGLFYKYYPVVRYIKEMQILAICKSEIRNWMRSSEVFFLRDTSGGTAWVRNPLM
jgi:hypothetical protein